jgi:hypothetical protein
VATCDGQPGNPGCGRRVVWMKNDKSGKPAMVDPEPNEAGNVLLDHRANTYHVMTKVEIAAAERPGMFDEPPPERFMLHFATCPHAENFKRCGKCHRMPCECARG